MRKAAVACVQFAPVLCDKEYNLIRMEYWIDQVMQEHPDTDLILFPELANSGYDGTRTEFQRMAEVPGAGETGKRLGRRAAQYHVYLAFGYPEEAGDVLYNSMMLLGRDGGVVYNYRKVHPFGSEKSWCEHGDAFCAVDTDFGKIGMLICYDTVFPEAARTLALQGAELLLISTNWENPYVYDWELTTASRAYDNILPLASANRVGMDRVTSFFGHSRILDPIGRPLETLDEEVEGYIWHQIDLEEATALRQGYYTTFQDRRPESYRLM